MGAKPPPLSSIAVAVAFALSVFGFTLFVWLSFGGKIPLQPRGYTFSTEFGPEASNLAANADVRISGVNVGKVAYVRQTQSGARATLELERKFSPLHSDARAIVRYKTLLGENFVELAPGSKDAPAIPEGGYLPRSHVEPVQPIDRILGTFDKPTRDAFKIFLRDFSQSLEGRGQDINSSLGNVAPTVEELTALTELVDRQEAAVRGLVRNGAIALQTIGSRSDQVQDIVVYGNRLLAATAASDESLKSTVRALPPFLRDLRTTVVEVEKTTDDAAPTLRELRPVAPLVKPALEGTSVLSPELEKLFHELGVMIPQARQSLTSLTHVVEASPPLIDTLHRNLKELFPITKLLNEYKHDGIYTAAKLGAATNGVLPRGDGAYRYLRVLIPLWNEGFVGAEERFGTNRHNPYIVAKALKEMQRGGLKAYDCENVNNPTPIEPLPIVGGVPECLVQGPWDFQGVKRSFPHPKPFEYEDR